MIKLQNAEPRERHADERLVISVLAPILVEPWVSARPPETGLCSRLQTREITVAQTFPIDIACKIERRWERPSHVAAMRLAQNDNHASDGLCPAC